MKSSPRRARVLGLIAAAVTGLAIDVAQAAPPAVSIEGSIAAPQRFSLPPESVALIELREATRADAPVELRAIAASRQALPGGRSPIPFRLDVERGALSETRSYFVRAAVLTSGRPAWLVVSRPIRITGDRVGLGTLLLAPARQPPPRTLSCGDRTATLRAGDVAELSVGAKRWLLSPVSAGSARYAAADAPLTTLWITDEQATLVVKGQPWAECTLQPFHASGYAPIWNLQIGTKNLRFKSDRAELRAATPPLSISDGVARYVTEAHGQRIAVAVYDRPCRHSPRGLPHPQLVEVTAFGKRYTGCGGEPLALLQGTEWVVQDIAGALPGRSPVTLNFGAEGHAYGQGPCNPYNASYRLTRNGLALSLDAAAQQSCEPGVMQREKVYLELLQRTQRFEIGSDGALVLRTASGRTISARASETP